MGFVPGEKKAEVREEGRQLTNSWAEEEKTRHLGMEGTNVTEDLSWIDRT